MNTELHLFIICAGLKRRRQIQNNIYRIIKEKFDVINFHKITCNSSSLLKLKCVHEKELEWDLQNTGKRGKTSFVLVAVEDRKAIYGKRLTSAGIKEVNLKMFDTKKLCKKNIEGKYELFGTETMLEVKHDLNLLFRSSPEEYKEKHWGKTEEIKLEKDYKEGIKEYKKEKEENKITEDMKKEEENNIKEEINKDEIINKVDDKKDDKEKIEEKEKTDDKDKIADKEDSEENEKMENLTEEKTEETEKEKENKTKEKKEIEKKIETDYETKSKEDNAYKKDNINEDDTEDDITEEAERAKAAFSSELQRIIYELLGIDIASFLPSFFHKKPKKNKSKKKGFIIKCKSIKDSFVFILKCPGEILTWAKKIPYYIYWYTIKRIEFTIYIENNSDYKIIRSCYLRKWHSWCKYFFAYDTKKEKEVLIKVSTEALVEREVEVYKRLKLLCEREIFAPEIIDYDYEGKYAWIAMEKLEGKTLKKLCYSKIRAWRPEGEIIKNLMVEMLFILDSLYEMKIIHRNISMENIFLIREDDSKNKWIGRLYLLDYCFAVSEKAVSYPELMLVKKKAGVLNFLAKKAEGEKVDETGKLLPIWDDTVSFMKIIRQIDKRIEEKHIRYWDEFSLRKSRIKHTFKDHDQNAIQKFNNLNI